MNASGWIQLIAFCIGLFLITKPMGIYLIRVLDPEVEGGMGILEKILGPFERLCYKIGRIDPTRQQNWKQYCIAVLVFGAVATVFSYSCYRVQDIMPLKQNMHLKDGTVALTNTVVKDPNIINGSGKVSPIIAFIQAVSF